MKRRGPDPALIRGILYNLKTTIKKVLNCTGNVFTSKKGCCTAVEGESEVSVE